MPRLMRAKASSIIVTPYAVKRRRPAMTPRATVINVRANSNRAIAATKIPRPSKKRSMPSAPMTMPTSRPDPSVIAI